MGISIFEYGEFGYTCNIPTIFKWTFLIFDRIMKMLQIDIILRITKFVKHFIQVDLQISKWSYSIITKTVTCCREIWCRPRVPQISNRREINSNLKIERYFPISTDLLWSRSYSFLLVDILSNRNFSTFSLFHNYIFYFNFTTSVLCRIFRRLFV